MAIDKLQIANLALSTIKARRLSTFPTGESTTIPEATLIFDWYDIIRDDVLSEFPWSFATKRYALVLASSQPTIIIDNLSVLYNIPNTGGGTPVADMIKPTFKSNKYAKLVIEAAGIYSNINSLSIKYTYRNDDPTTYSAAFISAFATRLAAAIALNRSESVSAAEGLLDQYHKIFLPRAKAADFQKDAQARPLQNSWEFARLNGNLWYPI